MDLNHRAALLFEWLMQPRLPDSGVRAQYSGAPNVPTCAPLIRGWLEFS